MGNPFAYDFYSHVTDLVIANLKGQRSMAEIKDPIVSMVEFQGRLWLATTKGVFVKRRNEDVFDPVELIPAPQDKPTGFGCDG